MKKALVTGITGQDGYFIAQLLISKGYGVIGIVRRNRDMRLGALEHLPEKLLKKIDVRQGDITDAQFIIGIVKSTQPDEVYHLAAQSFVGYSFHNPQATLETNIMGTLNVVNAVRDFSHGSKLYFAGTSELFGTPEKVPQDENTPMQPRSPYAISKLACYWLMKDYREAYKLFATNGILFNHESEVRGPEFVTRKISLAVAKIHNGSDYVLELGNMDARKDWGYAKDFVEGMWLMMQHKEPDDFVLGTGVLHTVREFTELAFKTAGMDVEWRGAGIDEKGFYKGREVVRVNPRFFRPLEAENMVADYSKAKRVLGWKPKTTFRELVKLMVESDIKNAK